MLLSKHIETLQKILKEKGDQELFMWVDSGQDTLFLSKVPEIEVAEIDGNQFQVKKEFRNENGKVLAITNLESGSFNEDEDECQNLDLEIL